MVYRANVCWACALGDSLACDCFARTFRYGTDASTFSAWLSACVSEAFWENNPEKTLEKCTPVVLSSNHKRNTMRSKEI